jgi:hypothetical protein
MLEGGAKQMLQLIMIILTCVSWLEARLRRQKNYTTKVTAGK